jgi:hypothetical protein
MESASLSMALDEKTEGQCCRLVEAGLTLSSFTPERKLKIILTYCFSLSGPQEGTLSRICWRVAL